MAHYTYKCVPVPTIVNTGQVGKDSHSAAVMTYEKIINNAANDGWELVQAIETHGALPATDHYFKRLAN